MIRYELTKERRVCIKELLPLESAGERDRPRKDAQWDALDRPQRSAVAGIAGGVWPPAVSIRPVCQMTGRRYIGGRVSSIVRRCGCGEPEFGLCLHQGSRKCQRRGKKRRIRQLDGPEAG